MRTLFTLLLLGTAFVSAQDAKIDELGKSPVEAKFVSGGRIRMDLCSSGIEIVGTDDAAVRVSYHPERDNVRVRLQISGDHADLRLTGCPHNNFQARIEIPKSSALYVRMMAGQLDVRDVTGDKDVELSFGQLNIDVGKTEQYARVDASVNSGQIDALAFAVSKGGLFRSFDQKGPGRYRVHAHVGAGQLELRSVGEEGSHIVARAKPIGWLWRCAWWPKMISSTSRLAPTTIALSARLNTGH